MINNFLLQLTIPQIIGIISVFFICVSIISFCLKTHPDMRVPNIRNVTVKTANQSSAWALEKTQTNAHVAFFYIECVCNAWFTFEIMVNMKFMFCIIGCVVYANSPASNPTEWGLSDLHVVSVLP